MLFLHSQESQAKNVGNPCYNIERDDLIEEQNPSDYTGSGADGVQNKY